LETGQKLATCHHAHQKTKLLTFPSGHATICQNTRAVEYAKIVASKRPLGHSQPSTLFNWLNNISPF